METKNMVERIWKSSVGKKIEAEEAASLLAKRREAVAVPLRPVVGAPAPYAGARARAPEPRNVGLRRREIHVTRRRVRPGA